MAELFADRPDALAGTMALAERLEYTMADLGYRFPSYPVPPGETEMSFLRHIAEAGSGDDLLVAVSSRGGESVAWIPSRGSPPTFDPQPEPAVKAGLEAPTWVTSADVSALAAALGTISVSPAASVVELPPETEPENVPEPAVEPIPAAMAATAAELPPAESPGAPGGSGGTTGDPTAPLGEATGSAVAQQGSGAGPGSSGGSGASSGNERDSATLSGKGSWDGLLAHAAPPEYPPLSVRAGEEGTVRCRLHIAASGEVLAVDVVVSSGHERLDKAAVKALRRWRFVPAKLETNEFPTTILHQVVFRLVS